MNEYCPASDLFLNGHHGPKENYARILHTALFTEGKVMTQVPIVRGFSSVQFSHSVMFDSLRPHESQHARPPCPYAKNLPTQYSKECARVIDTNMKLHPKHFVGLK